jgi:hypothetical protein
MRPELFLPPDPPFLSKRLFSGFEAVTSSKLSKVVKRMLGVVGLYFLIPIFLSLFDISGFSSAIVY